MAVAVAVALLAGSGLMLRSLGNLLAAPMGFTAQGVLTVALGRPDELGDPLLGPQAWGEDVLQMRLNIRATFFIGSS